MNRRNVIRLCPAMVFTALVSFVAGCGKPHRPTDKQLTPQEIALKRRKEIPAAITGREWRIRWFNRKTSGDRSLELVLLSDSSDGAITEPDNPTVLLHDVSARVYKDGVHTATIDAPVVTANQLTHTLIATGGAKVTSITDPPDTVITGDTMTLDTNTNILIATGRATATTIDAARRVSSTRGERLVFDTRLKEMRNE